MEFTRDYDVIRKALYNVEHYDKTCLGNTLQAASSMILTNWGTQNYCQVNVDKTRTRQVMNLFDSIRTSTHTLCDHIFHLKVLVFTHCGIGLGPTSVPQLINDLKGKAMLNAKLTPNPTTSSPQKSVAIDSASNFDWIPFSNSSKLSFICLGHTTDTYFQQALKIYQELVDVSAQHGQLFIAASDSVGDSSKKLNKNLFGADLNAQLPTIAQWKTEIMPQLIDKLCEINYKRFEAVLKCGGYHKLEAAIIIWPPPKVINSHEHPSIAYIRDSDRSIFLSILFFFFLQTHIGKETDVPRHISRKIEICGFMNLADIGSPMSISRHIVLPNENPSAHFANSLAQAEKLENEIKSFFTKGDDDDVSTTESNGTHADANKESVCVLLHGALKFENTAALVLLNDDWYGFIYSYADNKRKSNLMLTILPPGENIRHIFAFNSKNSMNRYSIRLQCYFVYSKDMMWYHGSVILDSLEPSKIRCPAKIFNFPLNQRNEVIHKIVLFG